MGQQRPDARWHMARSEAPHLILLDIRLPDISGFDVCRQLRSEGRRQPILMLTARDEEVDKVLGLELGADDYLVKPFSLRELISRIRALLRRAYGELAAPAAQRAAGLRLARRRHGAAAGSARRPVGGSDAHRVSLAALPG